MAKRTMTTNPTKYIRLFTLNLRFCFCSSRSM